jgi:Holliday junction DNA helicase RuvA
MIAYIQGDVVWSDADSLIVLVHGLGYEVYTAKPEKYRLNEQVSLFTYQQFKEDGQMLYGFETREEYDLFVQLLKVKGIGCRSALNMLRAVDADSILDAIENEDAAALKKLPGIGQKTAGQIIFDLKGKIVRTGSASSKPANPAWQECKEGLLALGYTPKDVAGLAQYFDEENMSVEVMLRTALQMLAKQKGF